MEENVRHYRHFYKYPYMELNKLAVPSASDMACFQIVMSMRKGFNFKSSLAHNMPDNVVSAYERKQWMDKITKKLVSSGLVHHTAEGWALNENNQHTQVAEAMYSDISRHFNHGVIFFISWLILLALVCIMLLINIRHPYFNILLVAVLILFYTAFLKFRSKYTAAYHACGSLMHVILNNNKLNIDMIYHNGSRNLELSIAYKRK